MKQHRYAWFDTGTFRNLNDANSFIIEVEKATKRLIGSIEEISFLNGWLNEDKIHKLPLKGEYYEYIRNLVSKKENKN